MWIADVSKATCYWCCCYSGSNGHIAGIYGGETGDIARSAGIESYGGIIINPIISATCTRKIYSRCSKPITNGLVSLRSNWQKTYKK